MPFTKGHSKAGGRKKGTPNKKTQELLERAEDIGCDPFEILLLFALGDWKALGYPFEFETRITTGGVPAEVRVIDPELRVTAAKEAAQYLYPKRKAIELSGPDGSDIPMKTSVDLAALTTDELALLRRVMGKGSEVEKS